MTYEEWEKGVPAVITGDPVWHFFAYRKALFLYDLMWEDCERLMRDPRGRAVVEQLTRSTGSISANIEEGYGRGYGRDRNYFLRIATGSARETRGWYHPIPLPLATRSARASFNPRQRNRRPSRN